MHRSLGNAGQGVESHIYERRTFKRTKWELRILDALSNYRYKLYYNGANIAIRNEVIYVDFVMTESINIKRVALSGKN